jgi:hypothetical protein
MDDCDCSIPVLHFLAIGAAELRARLSQYEDLGLEPKQIATLKDTTNELLNHLDKTYESERQLKVKVLKALEGMG